MIPASFSAIRGIVAMGNWPGSRSCHEDRCPLVTLRGYPAEYIRMSPHSGVRIHHQDQSIFPVSFSAISATCTAVPSRPGIRSCRGEPCPLVTLGGYRAGDSRNQRELSRVWSVLPTGAGSAVEDNSQGPARRDAPLGAPLMVLLARRRNARCGERPGQVLPAGCAMLAIGAGLLLDIATAGNRSRAEHATVWLIQCALSAFLVVCAVLDSRTRRRLRRLTTNSGQ
jgi:hypothetical protein